MGEFKGAIAREFGIPSNNLRVLDSDGAEYRDAEPVVKVLEKSHDRIPIVIQIPLQSHWVNSKNVSFQVELGNGGPISDITLRPDQTIQDLKNLLSTTHNIPTEDFVIEVNSKKARNSTPMDDFVGRLLTARNVQGFEFTLRRNGVSGPILTVRSNSGEYVYDIKEEIAFQTGDIIPHISIIGDGVKLDDGDLAINLVGKTLIYIVSNVDDSAGWKKIMYTTESGRRSMYFIDFPRDATVDDLKIAVARQHNVSYANLAVVRSSSYIPGKQLTDGLSYYFIRGVN